MITLDKIIINIKKIRAYQNAGYCEDANFEIISLSGMVFEAIAKGNNNWLEMAKEMCKIWDKKVLDIKNEEKKK